MGLLGVDWGVELFLGCDPAVGAGFEEVEGECAAGEHLVVEGAEVEVGA